jgi:cation-transporting ATPase E
VAERVALGLQNAFVHAGGRGAWAIVRENVFTVFNVTLFGALAATLALGLATPGARGIVLGDVVFSGGSVWLNLVVGIVQELRAKRVLDRLAALSLRGVRVRRNDRSVEVAAEEIVRDDLVELRPGDRAPVDGPVVEGRGVEMDESLLTGESDSVRKQVGERGARSRRRSTPPRGSTSRGTRSPCTRSSSPGSPVWPSRASRARSAGTPP